jgi:hypothetical protein
LFPPVLAPQLGQSLLGNDVNTCELELELELELNICEIKLELETESAI